MSYICIAKASSESEYFLLDQPVGDKTGNTGVFILDFAQGTWNCTKVTT